MKNLIRQFAVVLALTSQVSFADTVVLSTLPDTDPLLDVVAIAKIQDFVEVRLTNAGLVADTPEQRFAFGQAGGDPTDGEDYEINPAAADLQAHTCAGAGAAHIQRLIEDAARPGACVVDAGATRSVTANFVIGYEIVAIGAEEANFFVDVENGVDLGLENNSADRAFLSASVSQVAPTGTLVIPTATATEGALSASTTADVGTANLAEINNGDTGSLNYELQFDLAGANVKPESRVVFRHTLLPL